MAEVPAPELHVTLAAPRKKRRPWVRALQVLISIAVVVAVFFYAIPKFADYGKVWDTIKSLSLLEVLILVAVTAFNVFTYWPQMTASFPGLTIAQAAVNNQSSTTVANTVPGGGVVANGVTVGMYRAWGFEPAEIGLSMTLTAIWNSFIKLGLPIVAVVILVLQRRATSSLIVPGLIGLGALIGVIALFGLALWKKGFARRIGTFIGAWVNRIRRVLRKEQTDDWSDAGVRFRKQTLKVVDKRWGRLTFWTVVSHLGLYVVLLACVRFAGISEEQVTWAQVLGVFAVGRLITALPITPGGLGVVELAYIAGLVLAGRHHTTTPLPVFRAQCAAAVLMFRALTYGAQIPLGAFTYGIFKWKKSWLKPRWHADPEALAPATVAT